MAEEEPTPGRPIRRVQSERVELDLSGLNREQIDELRTKMKSMAAGMRDPKGDFAEFGGIEALRSHSSHNDDDGWV